MLQIRKHNGFVKVITEKGYSIIGIKEFLLDPNSLEQ